MDNNEMPSHHGVKERIAGDYPKRESMRERCGLIF